MDGSSIVRLAVRSQRAAGTSTFRSTRSPYAYQRHPWTPHGTRIGSAQFTRSVSSSPQHRKDGKPAAQDRDGSMDGMANMLDKTLDMSKGIPTVSSGRQSHFASRLMQEEQKSEGSGGAALARTPKSMSNSITDMLQDIAAMGPKPRGSTKGVRMDTSTMRDPTPAPGSQASRIARDMQQLPLPLSVRLGPNLGRTVKVNPVRNIDAGKAFRQLDILCNRNRVRADFHRQRFHERPGLRRKRLKRERWRRHFKEGFKGMVALVKKMKKQGW
ncbi:37S ribosomal protein mrp21, mitochondrial [Sphaceloma murrayae]|uniref:37S ribosomal protein mrp21, mitochondrial n=1 Tax=Sphaceloma murrayae TaxID=2082308 RepID=A0A2K1QYL1_9PEZI|nr:37S ribosomal protein mrp21, mitochondrial [Sphaceloma murrayae]